MPKILLNRKKVNPCKNPNQKKTITIKPSTKLSQLLSSSGKVLNDPQKIVSIAEMRDEELNMTSAPGKLKLTFAELFKRRLNLISGKRQKFELKFMLK